MDITAPERSPARWYRSLFVQIAIGVALGVLVGVCAPSAAPVLNIVGQGFIRLIEMVIAPLVFIVVVTGIVHVGDLRAVGRIAGKAMVYFFLASSCALVFGLLVGNLVRPGAGLQIDPSSLDGSAVAAKTAGGSIPDAGTFILDLIPSSVANAFATNDILQVLVFAVFVGSAIAAIGPDRSRSLVRGLDLCLEVVYRILGWVMRLSPLGAFGAMAYVVGQYGIETLASYGLLIAACYGAAAVFIVALLVIGQILTGVPVWRFVWHTRAEFGLALGTASTEAVLPRMITRLTEVGVSRSVAGLVVPTGYSFNLDGAAIYLSIALLFLTQAFGMPLTLEQQVAALGVLLLTSKGMAGVPGSSFLALSATATSLGLFPVAGVALLLGADRIMDSMRVSVNLLGNCVAALVVARWQGALDRDRVDATLRPRRRSQTPPVLAEPAPSVQ
ncbi:cation:dicarboxylate symporter family transporter [Curtobacterium sp. 18060]|uniref:cation:dicarboxylate symporter family transporter n=1 Tax=Curtobacterium sp. 18060 TaxID=2681408 RepID=UPI001359ACEF|nr:cation:dicarboxylase symporter family transporter [Curtobacterium sp. 18060]